MECVRSVSVHTCGPQSHLRRHFTGRLSGKVHLCACEPSPLCRQLSQHEECCSGRGSSMVSALGHIPTASVHSAVSRSYLSSVAQVCSAFPSPSGLDPTKLTVSLSSGAGDIYSTPRRYTLTHSDLTGRLQLSVGMEYNKHQLSGWYLQLVRCAKLSVRAQLSGLPITASPPCVFYTETRSWQSGA